MSRAKQRLREKGIDANEISPSRKILVPHTSLWIAPEGHPLFDPRSRDPVNVEMAQDMVARHRRGLQPNTDALYVWETQISDDEPEDVLAVGDGHGREAALRHAAKLLGKGVELMVEVELHTGDQASFLLERARRNDHGRFGRNDSRSVLAFRVKQLLSAGVTAKEIAAVMPREIGPAEVDALDRWDALCKEAKARFDGGAPIVLLPTIVELPSSRQIPELERLQASGVRTKTGATRARNKAKDERDPWARRMSPRQMAKVAAVLDHRTSRRGHYGDGFRDCLRLLASKGREAEAIAKNLPDVIADAIREARAGGRKA